jgi:hypothetical protein
MTVAVLVMDLLADPAAGGTTTELAALVQADKVIMVGQV